MNLQIELDGSTFDVVVTVKLSNGKTEEFNISDDIAIDPNDLNQEFIEQPGKFSWWSMVAEVAKNRMEESKAELEQAEAEADERVREALELEGVKITESLVTRKIKSDKFFKQAQNDYLRMKKTYGILSKSVSAFDQRMDALISIGANQRKDYDNSEVRVMQEQAKKVMKRK